jgi:ketosteroid isomerase-like protein
VREVETVQQIYDTLASGGPEAVADLFDPDIEWDTSAAPTGVKSRGHEAALGDFTGMLEAWEEFEIRLERLLPGGADDTVVAIVRNRGRGRAGGVPTEGQRAHLWRVRDGRAVAMRLYFDPREALDAAGIDPSS